MSFVSNERIATDGKIATVTGRLIPVPPSIRTDTSQKCAKDLKKHDAWWIEQARAEALSRGDDFNLHWINQMRPGKLSKADKDCANVYLFGKECIECRL